MNQITNSEYALRLIIVVSILVYINFYNFDYKIPLSILAVSYFIGSLILYPLSRGNFLKHFLYIIDVSIITYFTYTTGSTYFSLFWIPFLFYMKNIYDVILFSIYTFIIFGISLYLSGFSDFTVIFLLFSFIVVLVKDYFETQYFKKRISYYNNIAKEIYLENLKCNDKSMFYKRFYNIYNAISLFKNRKLEDSRFVNTLFENLNADSIILYDKVTNNFFTKSLSKIQLKNIDVKLFEDKIYVGEYFNRELGFKYIISKHFDNHILLILYKNTILDEEEILKIIA